LAALVLPAAFAIPAALAAQDAHAPPAAAPQGAQMAGAVVLKMRFKAGQTDRFEMHSLGDVTYQNSGQVKQGPLPHAQSGVVTWHVDRALPNGGGLITMTNSITESQVGGHAVPAPPAASATITYDAQGQIVASSWRAAHSHAAPILPGAANPVTSVEGVIGILSFSLPDHPVKVGDTWSAQAHLPGTGISGVVRNTLVRIETVGKYRCAHIRMTAILPMRLLFGGGKRPTVVTRPSAAVAVATGTETMTTDLYFAIDEGKPIKSGAAGQFVIQLRPPATGAAKPHTPVRTMNMLATINMSMDLMP
jgi:hypothetical protein